MSLTSPAPTKPLPLFAKSSLEGQARTLAEHSADVIEAFEALFGTPQTPSRLATSWLRFFRLAPEDLSAFYANGVAAGGLHDLGKANDGFQRAVTQNGEQVIRHEHLSGLLLALPELSAWLQSCPDIDLDLVLSAVVGHHLKAAPDAAQRFPRFGAGMGDGDRFRVYVDAPDFSAVLERVAGRLGLPTFSARITPWWSLQGAAEIDSAAEAERLVRRFKVTGRLLKQNPRRHRLLLAVKAAVIAADAAGSALIREHHDVRPWLALAFPEAPLTGAHIEREIIQRRMAQLAENGRLTAGQRLHPFQEAALGLGERALLIAPCGTGKTLAAWQWIRGQLDRRLAGRALFLYPTRATATEGFRDYVSWAPEDEAGLLHGSSAYELQGMFGNPEDRDDTRRARRYETEDRLFAVGCWSKRIFSATVDQLLGFLQQAYRSLCLLPVLADAVVVIDEVHSFDRAMFAALLRFLESFDVPVLCMTASLPEHRRSALVRCGLSLFPGAEAFPDLEHRAGLPRYQVHTLDGDAAAEAVAIAALERGERVLWVVNTVRRCQEIARRLNDLPGVPPEAVLCYHSRFRLEDRKSRHDTVIRAFAAGSGPVIAVTTQVCEMSLDLDAATLITEQAPITALIQRMGRCNRHAKTESDPRGQVFIYPAGRQTPYDTQDLAGVDRFIDALKESEASQTRLETLLETLGPQEKDQPRLTAFIDDGLWSIAGQETFREGLDFTDQALLEDHIPAWIERRRRGQPADGLLVPVPRGYTRTDPRVGRFPKVVQGGQYDPRYGFIGLPEREAV